MTKNIAFYISNHGFGHAARNIPILNTLLKLEEDMQIHVKTGKNQLDFIKSHLKNDERFHFYEENIDIGIIVKEGSMLVDEEAMVEQIGGYVDSWGKRIEVEKEFFLKEKIGLVVSDVCPWVFLATDELRIKSILIGNFTWVEIYKEFLPEDLWDAYLECYEAASLSYIYEFHLPEMETYNNNNEMLSLVCRAYDMEEIMEIQAQFKQPIIMIGVGMAVSLEEEIEVGHLPYDFVVTPGLKVKGDNVTYLPVGTKNTQNYVAASKYVITKAGWSTTAEIILCNKKAAYVERPTVAEDRNTIQLLVERGQGIAVKEEELKDIGAIIDRLDAFEYSYEHEYHNDDYEIAKKILYAYPKRMRRRK